MGASPDCYTFSSTSARERQRAVKQTLQTIDFAAQLGAPFVVLHLGRVPIKPVTERLIALAKAGEMYSREYVRRKVDAVAKREAAAPAYLDNVKECLKPIIEHAAAKNIRLGIEGRRGYEEIPSEREIPPLLDELNSPQVGYWHDIGHLQVKENLGFLNHEGWLRAIGPRTMAVTCRIAFGQPRIISHPSPATSIWRNSFRSCRRPAYLSGK
jgi:sugar phosphate isomerase/epimerase